MLLSQQNLHQMQNRLYGHVKKMDVMEGLFCEKIYKIGKCGVQQNPECLYMLPIDNLFVVDNYRTITNSVLDLYNIVNQQLICVIVLLSVIWLPTHHLATYFINHYKIPGL